MGYGKRDRLRIKHSICVRCKERSAAAGFRRCLPCKRAVREREREIVPGRAKRRRVRRDLATGRISYTYAKARGLLPAGAGGKFKE